MSGQQPSSDQNPPSAAFEEEIAPDGQPMRAGSLVVRFQADVPQPARDLVFQAIGVVESEALLMPDTVRVTVPRGTVATALSTLAARPEVAWAEPDYVARPGAGAGAGI